jgi:Cu/Ag efflux protein CusF
LTRCDVTRRAARRHPRLTTLFALAFAFACGPRAETAAPASYPVRGEVVSMPGAGGREVLIRHESVPGLRNAAGEVVGMESMTMPFALGEDVDRATLAVGDRIEFVLEVRWDDRDPVTVTQVTKLPPGTRLEFDPPQPEAATPVSPEGETPSPPEGETPSPPGGETPR